MREQTSKSAVTHLPVRDAGPRPASELAGKTAIVTGGYSGIGLETAIPGGRQNLVTTTISHLSFRKP